MTNQCFTKYRYLKTRVFGIKWSDVPKLEIGAALYQMATIL